MGSNRKELIILVIFMLKMLTVTHTEIPWKYIICWGWLLEEFERLLTLKLYLYQFSLSKTNKNWQSDETWAFSFAWSGSSSVYSFIASKYRFPGSPLLYSACVFSQTSSLLLFTFFEMCSLKHIQRYYIVLLPHLLICGV